MNCSIKKILFTLSSVLVISQASMYGMQGESAPAGAANIAVSPSEVSSLAVNSPVVQAMLHGIIPQLKLGAEQNFGAVGNCFYTPASKLANTLDSYSSVLSYYLTTKFYAMAEEDLSKKDVVLELFKLLNILLFQGGFLCEQPSLITKMAQYLRLVPKRENIKVKSLRDSIKEIDGAAIALPDLKGLAGDNVAYINHLDAVRAGLTRLCVSINDFSKILGTVIHIVDVTYADYLSSFSQAEVEIIRTCVVNITRFLEKFDTYLFNEFVPKFYHVAIDADNAPEVFAPYFHSVAMFKARNFNKGALERILGRYQAITNVKEFAFLTGAAFGICQILSFLGK